ncbi:MAG: tRNA epoxyqueuosine(34) reductase QueG [Bacteroidales bacterium]|nr:tRNA epoxyqueuosine(34) reductase QueG [Bacteroidales bacterium]
MTEENSKYIKLEEIVALSQKQGFCVVGATKIEKVENDFLDSWLDKGYNASMKYMENYIELRKNPSLLVPYAKTILCFLMSYNDERVDNEHIFKIASYAQRKDYHFVMKEKLRNIISSLQEKYTDLQAIAFVDSAPVLERYWAEKCGLGWKGKNSLLVNKEYGSKVFIGEIFCNITTDYFEEQIINRCGTCTRCIDICPNGAITKTGEIDSKRCISYQTIENKQEIPYTFDTKNYIYGCDLCIEVCPWNKKAKKVDNQDIETKELMNDVLNKISENELDRTDFNKLKKVTPLSRIKYDKLISNVENVKKRL